MDGTRGDSEWGELGYGSEKKGLSENMVSQKPSGLSSVSHEHWFSQPFMAARETPERTESCVSIGTPIAIATSRDPLKKSSRDNPRLTH